MCDQLSNDVCALSVIKQQPAAANPQGPPLQQTAATGAMGPPSSAGSKVYVMQQTQNQSMSLTVSEC